MAADRFWFITKATLELPARLLDSEQRQEITGVVGSYETTRQSILYDLAQVVLILAIISLSLAIVNLFPFLPLDGGHIFWAIVEKVRGKPVPFSVMERAGVVGFMLVILIFLVGLTNDIDRLSGEGFSVEIDSAHGGHRARAVPRGRRASVRSPWRRPFRPPRRPIRSAWRSGRRTTSSR